MKFKTKHIITLLVSAGVFAASGSALANDSDELEKLRALVQELDQKVRVLDRKNELAEEAAATKKKETPIVNASEKGFGFKSADGAFEIKLKGLIQADYRYFNQGFGGTGINTTNTPAADGFLLRRIRPTIEGTVFDKYDFRFTPEFGENKTTSNSGIVDAYVDARFTPWFQIRAGKFKPYVGLERLQSGADIKFVERSYVTNALLPNRDVGASIHGDVLDGKLTYALGVFNGVADGGDATTSADSNQDKDYAARIFTTPFKDDANVLSGLGFGIATTYGDVKGTAASTNLTSGYKTDGQQNFFQYAGTTIADGKRLRFAPQAYYYYGPFGVIAEYARVSQEINTAANAGHKTVDHDAWQIAGSYLITGEDASFKGVKPKNAFDLDNGGWGAWELVARYSELNLDEDTFKNAANTAFATTYASRITSATSASSWTAGVNWYLNPEVKLALDYEQTSFEAGGGGTATNPIDRKDERAVLGRFQIAF
ncbi:MAG: OprO/OprP family phosphate-selective porin [Methylophilales bacterium]|nr:OprO/OprP family phosphate-selective porin [Methylophilales bacterium]